MWIRASNHLMLPPPLPDRPRPPDARPSRRGFLLAGLGLLAAGCAQPPRLALPSPAWDLGPDLPDMGTGPDGPPPPPGAARLPAPSVPLPWGTIPRRRWASGEPVPALMNRMAPVRYVTVHHDGMRPFFGDSAAAGAARLEAIRRAHRRRHWGDIGYHFGVDRAGDVWEARPLSYQGAHVRHFNRGNVGVVCLGNFDEQQPTPAQLEALHHHVLALMRRFDVPVTRLRTHQQWAPTRCPGRNLQRFMDVATSNGMFG